MGSFTLADREKTGFGNQLKGGEEGRGLENLQGRKRSTGHIFME